MAPEFPTGRVHCKQWEIAMAVLALRDVGCCDPAPKCLASAPAARRPCLVQNHVRRVCAADLYVDPASG